MPQWASGTSFAKRCVKAVAAWLQDQEFTHFMTLTYRRPPGRRRLFESSWAFVEQVAHTTRHPVFFYEGLENRPGHMPHHHLLLRVNGLVSKRKAAGLWRSSHPCAGDTSWKEVRPGPTGLYEYVACHAEFNLGLVEPPG